MFFYIIFFLIIKNKIQGLSVYLSFLYFILSSLLYLPCVMGKSTLESLSLVHLSSHIYIYIVDFLLIFMSILYIISIDFDIRYIAIFFCFQCCISY